MELIDSEGYYEENFDKMMSTLVDWSKETFTNPQAAELAGYNEENWNKVGVSAHATHIEYLIGDYDRYHQNFQHIFDVIGIDMLADFPIIKTKQDLLDFYADEVEQDADNTLLDSVMWLVACWMASSYLTLGTKHFARALLGGIDTVNEDSIQEFIDEIRENSENEKIANLCVVLNVFQHIGDERMYQVAKLIEQLEKEDE